MSESESRVVEFFFDVASPYSYLAATQMPGLAERTGARVRFRPFLLGAVFKATGNEAPARVPAKARFMLEDLSRWAAEYDVPFRFPKLFPINSLSPMRALTAACRLFGEEAVPAFAGGLFEAYWVEGIDIQQGDEISFRAGRAGLDVAKLAREIGAPANKDALRAWTDEAIARGAFGAPTFFVGDQLFWGNDRLGQVEAALR